MITTTIAAVPRPGGLGIAATASAVGGHDILSQAAQADQRPVLQPSEQQGARLQREDAHRPIRDALHLQQKRPSSRGVAAQTDAPQDRAVFRAQVIKLLTALHHDDQSFQKALKRGTIIIRATPDQSQDELRLEQGYELYRKAALEAVRLAEARETRSGRSLPTRIGPQDFIAWWPN